MDLEEQTGVDPVIEKRCEECGATLTEGEIKAALDSGGAYLCSVHALENVQFEEEDEPL